MHRESLREEVYALYGNGKVSLEQASEVGNRV